MSRADDIVNWCKAGCVWIAILWVGGCLFCGIVDVCAPAAKKCSDSIREQYKEIKERRIEKESQERRLAEEQRVHSEKDARVARLKAFAESESPELFRILSQLRGEVEVQEKKIAELRKVLVEFSRDPESDADYKEIVRMQGELKQTISEIEGKVEEAYIASKKFEATPGRKDYDDIRRRAIEEGVNGAELAIKRFTEMRKSK